MGLRQMFIECPVCDGKIGKGRRCKTCGLAMPKDSKQAQQDFHQMKPARTPNRLSRSKDFMLVSMCLSASNRQREG